MTTNAQDRGPDRRWGPTLPVAAGTGVQDPPRNLGRRPQLLAAALGAHGPLPHWQVAWALGHSPASTSHGSVLAQASSTVKSRYHGISMVRAMEAGAGPDGHLPTIINAHLTSVYWLRLRPRHLTLSDHHDHDILRLGTGTALSAVCIYY